MTNKRKIPHLQVTRHFNRVSTWSGWEINWFRSVARPDQREAVWRRASGVGTLLNSLPTITISILFYITSTMESDRLQTPVLLEFVMNISSLRAVYFKHDRCDTCREKGVLPLNRRWRKMQLTVGGDNFFIPHRLQIY